MLPSYLCPPSPDLPPDVSPSLKLCSTAPVLQQHNPRLSLFPLPSRSRSFLSSNIVKHLSQTPGLVLTTFSRLKKLLNKTGTFWLDSHDRLHKDKGTPLIKKSFFSGIAQITSPLPLPPIRASCTTFLDVKNDVFAHITEPSNDDYNNDVSDNCDDKFGTFDDFGV